MRRTAAVVCAAAMLLGVGMWGVSAAGLAGRAEKATPLTAGLMRATRVYGTGPSADYSGDVGNIGVVTPLHITFPAGRSYVVVVTISLDYRTSPDDRFVVGALVRRDSQYGHKEPVVPSERAISVSTSRTSTTACFRLVALRGGHEYWFSPTVNVSHRVGTKASIASTRVLMVVESTPI